jgi:hypothetical protein
MTTIQKIHVAILIYAVWLFLVLYTHASTDTIISWLQSTLIALGVVHVAGINIQTKQPDSNVAPNIPPLDMPATQNLSE